VKIATSRQFRNRAGDEPIVPNAPAVTRVSTSDRNRDSN